MAKHKGQFPSGNEHPNRKKYLQRLDTGTAVCFVCNEEKRLTEFTSEKGHYINRCKSCSSRETRKRQEVHAEAFRKLKESIGCIRCGENDPYCLDFHHRNPEDKVFELSTRGTRPLSAEILGEIAKCEVLCRNCHAKLHAGRFSLEDILNGT